MRKPTKSLREIAELDEVTIRPVDVAGALKIDPFLINVSFKQGNPMFPGFMSGNRVHIIRSAFLKQIDYEMGGE